MKTIYGKILLTVLTLSVFASLSSAAKIEVSGNDTMQFSAKAFEVPAGEEVTLVFTNKGSLPKAAMGHNVVVLQSGSDVMAFGAAATTAAGSEYIPQNEPHSKQIVAHTKLLGPGESDTITFTLDKPGEYPFLCSFPGHYALMRGIITAK